MDNFTIAITHASAEHAEMLLDMLNVQTAPLHLNILWQLDPHPHQAICCMNGGDSKWTAADRKRLFRETSRGLARYIVDVEEENLLRGLFAKEFAYTGEDEVNRLLGFCRQMAEELEPQRKKQVPPERIRLIAQEVETCLKDFGGLNLEGLLVFRLKEYKELLRETADYALDEYLMDKQYQEFISLLKYFVFIQQAKVPSVHVLHMGGSEFVLLDEAFKPIEPSGADSITVETLEKELNFEDLIVSTLISVAPAKIHIHTEQPDIPVIKTIFQIFEERAELCRCSMGGAFPYKASPRKHTPG